MAGRKYWPATLVLILFYIDSVMKARSEKFDITGEIIAMFGVDKHGEDYPVDDFENALWVHVKDPTEDTTVPLNTEHDEVRIVK